MVINCILGGLILIYVVKDAIFFSREVKKYRETIKYIDEYAEIKLKMIKERENR